MEHPNKDDIVPEAGTKSAKRARLKTPTISGKVTCCPRLGMGERVQVSKVFENITVNFSLFYRHHKPH